MECSVGAYGPSRVFCESRWAENSRSVITFIDTRVTRKWSNDATGESLSLMYVIKSPFKVWQVLFSTLDFLHDVVVTWRIASLKMYSLINIKVCFWQNLIVRIIMLSNLGWLGLGCEFNQPINVICGVVGRVNLFQNYIWKRLKLYRKCP